MTDIDRTIEEARAEMLPFNSWERLPNLQARNGFFCNFHPKPSMSASTVLTGGG